MKKYLLPLILILLLTFTLTGNCGWLSGYDQRIKLTIDNTKIDGALSNFPVTVFFTSTQGEEIFVEFDADGDYMKCAFTTSDGTTQLYAEKELFDDSAQKAIYHVKVTSVASGADTDIYYYYDNDHADNTTYIGAINTTAGGHVWDDNFKLVHHQTDATTTTVVDSTSINNDGTKKAANEPLEVTGKVGKGQIYDGTDDNIRVQLGSMPLVNDTKTISLIVKGDLADKYFGAVASRNNIGGINNDTEGYLFIVDNNRILYGHTNHGNYIASPTISAGTWYFCALTIGTNAATPLLYLNGIAQDPTTNTIETGDAENTNGYWTSGNQSAVDGFSDGQIDEIRISNSIRNAAWIKATYNTLWDSLLTYGSQETEAADNAIFFGCTF